MIHNPRKKHNSLFTIHDSRKSAGFTLLEILIVMGIIAILAAVMIVTLDPVGQFAKARNTERWNDINLILDATYRYAIDNSGTLPSAITTSDTEICQESQAVSTCTAAGLIRLKVLVDDGYLPELPVDPSCPTVCNANGVGYTISKDSNNFVVVSAPDAELSEEIYVWR